MLIVKIAQLTEGFDQVSRVGDKFTARISTKGKREYLGVFDTAEEAAGTVVKRLEAGGG